MVRFVDGMRMACKWSIDHIIPVYGKLREVSNQPAFPAPDADEVGPPPFRGLPAAGCAGILGQGSGPEALFLSAPVSHLGMSCPGVPGSMTLEGDDLEVSSVFVKRLSGVPGFLPGYPARGSQPRAKAPEAPDRG